MEQTINCVLRPDALRVLKTGRLGGRPHARRILRSKIDVLLIPVRSHRPRRSNPQQTGYQTQRQQPGQPNPAQHAYHHRASLRPKNRTRGYGGQPNSRNTNSSKR